MQISPRPWIAATLLVIALSTAPASSAGAAAPRLPLTSAPSAAAPGWLRPVEAPITVGFRAPAHEYGPGHRGIDFGSRAGDIVSAPAAGVVQFAGRVVDRGVLTIDHGDGLVSTLEPVVSALRPGDDVTAGAPVGHVGTGGHATTGSLHFGLRLHGTYIDPRLRIGGGVRAVLLPCC